MQLLSVLGIVAGFLFLLHGTQKLFAIPPSASGRTVELASRLGAAGVIETVGGLLILLGLFTRPPPRAPLPIGTCAGAP